MGYYRDQAAELYKERGYTTDPVTLALGVCEETGELAKAINMFHNRLFVPSDHAKSDPVDHEIVDILLYLGALANATNSKVDF